jgi:hypothetical protein
MKYPFEEESKFMREKKEKNFLLNEDQFRRAITNPKKWKIFSYIKIY